MTLNIDFYASFRSPYCYLVMARARELAARETVAVNLRVVYPLAVRHRDVFVKAPPQRLSYPRLDRRRMADYLGLPFADPDPDPLLFGDDRRPLPHQPYIHRLSRLGIEAAAKGRGLEFFDEVMSLIWNGTVKGWHRGRHLADASERAGLDPGPVPIRSQPPRFPSCHESRGVWRARDPCRALVACCTTALFEWLRCRSLPTRPVPFFFRPIGRACFPAAVRWLALRAAKLRCRR